MMHRSIPIRAIPLLVCVIGVIGVISCTRPAGKGNTTQPAQGSQHALGEIRIVSLSPAISRTLVDFDLQDRVVGRTPHCASLDSKIPVVGDLTTINFEQLVRLNPTHILIQPPATGMDQHLVDLAREKAWKVVAWHLEGIDDIETMVRELPTDLFADGSPQLVAASARSAELLNAIAAALSPGDKPVYRGRTLIVYELFPLRVFGMGTYLSDVLTAVGGSNAVQERGWLEMSMEDAVRLNPDAIIIVKPGGLKGMNVAQAAGPLFEADTTAAIERRMATLVNPDAFLPSSAVIGVAEELRSVLWEFAKRPQ